jgi:hypothetical protein
VGDVADKSPSRGRGQWTMAGVQQAQENRLDAQESAIMALINGDPEGAAQAMGARREDEMEEA